MFMSIALLDTLRTCAAGYMSAKACTSGKTVLDLWKLADSTNRQLYTVKRTTGTDPGIIGVKKKLEST